MLRVASSRSVLTSRFRSPEMATTAVAVLLTLVLSGCISCFAQSSSGFPSADGGEMLARKINDQLERRNARLPKDLQATVSNAMLPPDINNQRWVAAQPGAKIVVKQDGMYRVTRDELQNAGFDVNSNSANWRLFMEGNEQAIIVGAGDQYVEFFGRGLDTPESDSRVYYLIVDAGTVGKRIHTRVLNNLGGTVVSTSYLAFDEKKERTQYFSVIANGPENNYFGSLIVSDPPARVSFTLTNVDVAAAACSMTIRLQGLSYQAEHNILARLNGHALGFVTGNFHENFSTTFTGVPTTFLVEGTNSLEMVASGTDYALFDTVTVNYPRRYVAEQNKLPFYMPGYRKVNVGNFATPNIRVFDTTYDSNTQLLVNFQTVEGGGTFSAKLPSDRAAVTYAVEDSALLRSPSITFNSPSTLSTPANAADVIIISYSVPAFMTVAEQWANYRRSAAGGAFRVKVVDIADVYDEFSYGSQSVHAVEDLLAYADANWLAPAPRYVLIIGDSSYDPRNYEGTGNWALVPTKMVNTISTETGSDDAMVPDLDQNGVPDMAIGRIPARASVDIISALNKTIAFETPLGWDLEHRGAMCAYDSVFGRNYVATCLAYMSHMPQGTPITYIASRDPGAHEQLISVLNGGPYIANFTGHGNAAAWGTNFFTTDDVPLLVNRDRQSIYTMLTCLNGYFIRPVPDSLAEALVKAPNGGGVATWASTVDTTPDIELSVGERFYQQVALGQINRMGDLVVDARSHSLPPTSDASYSWILLGDPALKVRP